MKIITIFNFPDDENYNSLCKWWLKQTLANTDLPIEIWYSDNKPSFSTEGARLIRKPTFRIDDVMQPDCISPKARHNVGFKLFNLCEQTEPFIFIDADAIPMKNLQHLVDHSSDKPVIMVDHEVIQGHTAHIRHKFLNSGMQVVSDPSFLNFNEIMTTQNEWTLGSYVCPGTDQAMLFLHFLKIKYDYTHPKVGFEWNHCAGLYMKPEDIAINHYWYNFKPWQIDCPIYKDYLNLNEDK